MLQIDLDKLIENIFKMDIRDNNKVTSISEITSILIKSFLPNDIGPGNIINYRRFQEELSLWKYYRSQGDNILHNISGDDNTWDYFRYIDDSLHTRLLPIIFANPDYSIGEKEGIKNLLFTTGDLKALWNWIASMKTIHSIIEGKPDIGEDLKAYIINFSQVDFLSNYEEFYRFPLKDYPGNLNIQFEREKINILNILNGVNVHGYDEVKDLLNIIKGEEPYTTLGRIIIYSQKKMDLDVELPIFYVNLCNYILRLRKSRINPKDLKIDKYNLPDIFSFKEGEVFFHSLIKEGKVIKKEVRDKTLTSLVQTRSGMYLFKRDPF